MSPLLQRICVLAGIIVLFNFEGSTALICYHCNSEYDPRCGDPFDAYSLGEVNCSMQESLEHLPNLVPTLCRKTTQKVYGKIRVVRGCGYITDERDDRECMKRSGTHDVQAIYCACTTDRCNGARSMLITSSDSIINALPLAFTIILLILTYYQVNRL